MEGPWKVNGRAVEGHWYTLWNVNGRSMVRPRKVDSTANGSSFGKPMQGQWRVRVGVEPPLVDRLELVEVNEDGNQ